jgi:hypothetical protein
MTFLANLVLMKVFGQKMEDIRGKLKEKLKEYCYYIR